MSLIAAIPGVILVGAVVIVLMVVIIMLPVIGKHVHDGEVEYYCILAGQGVVTEDTGESTVNPGDVVVTGWGQSHSIRNDRDEDLEFIAVINTEK